MSKWQLFSMLAQEGCKENTIQSTRGNEFTGIVQGVDRESGDGHNFTVKMLVEGIPVAFYVRTID